MDRTRIALELAREVGFDLAGIAPLAPPPDGARFRAWLARGRHGEMAWLERNAERILDPERIAPGARSLLVVGLGHSRAAGELPGGGKVARYALGRDYHNWMGRRLRRLARRLEREGLAGPWRAIVDAGPLLERSHAHAAGLGFPSKAANLLHPRFGPWFFLGELLLGEELEPTPTPPAGSCGTCTACIDACPTGAIIEPGLVHAPDCISYLSIEHRGPIPERLRPAMGGWVFGCDVCSEVCPWGHRAPDLAERFGHHPALERPLTAWLEDRDRPAEAGRELWRGSPVQRPGAEGRARNAAIALANLADDALPEGAEAALVRRIQDASPTVREAAGWALARIGPSRSGREALESAWRREEDPGARASLRRHLEREGGSA